VYTPHPCNSHGETHRAVTLAGVPKSKFGPFPKYAIIATDALLVLQRRLGRERCIKRNGRIDGGRIGADAETGTASW
jgi:hypothetical protein